MEANPQKLELLPEDIVFFEIFSHVPLKSLYQFRSVTKFSNSLTSNPCFIKSYFANSPNHSLISFSTNEQCTFYVIDYKSFEASEAKKLNFFDKHAYYTYGKSINGLLCLARNNYTAIHHPGLNQKIELPLVENYSDSDVHFVHFCHDPVMDKYKVLRVTCVGTYFTTNLTVETISYKIFTLGVDKMWRDFEHKSLFQLGRSRTVCINGVLYCTNFSTSTNVKNRVIAAFHVGSERFETISYPEDLDLDLDLSSCFLVQVKGRLAVIDTTYFLKFLLVKIWIYNSNEWGMERIIKFPDQWETIATISLNISFCTNREGEIVMAVSGFSTPKCWIFCCDLETETWRRIEVLGMEQHHVFSNFLIEDYVENPASLRDQISNVWVEF